ncbi:Bystin-domain-containing protein [Geopyxis carbonaria]|nr:Bystin-domain-containing protein [Geopyxis carbonaria]
MPKESTSVSRQQRRHNPLHEELIESGDGGHLRKVARSKRRERQERPEDYVDSGLSQKILKLAKGQQEELREEELSAANLGFAARSAFKELSSDDDEFEEYGEEDVETDEIEEIIVDEGDEELFNRFLPSQPAQRISLADKILEKIAEHEAKLTGNPTEIEDGRSLPPKVVEVYAKVGILLSRWKSGKLPKAFKIIPSLRNWEEILFITRPDKWTPHAFMFLSLVLLDRVRDDIQEFKKLNVHLYSSIKKSLYKPAAFFKGFLFPLISSGTCTLKEAQIIGSVIARISIPSLHSAAALLHLCEMDYTGPTSVFIKTLIDKKYALPYKVVDALVFHYLRFKGVPEQLPLLWHKSFLVFAQRYRNDITEDQRDALLDLLLIKAHALIGPEIRRELIQGRGRGQELDMMQSEEDLMLE